MTTGGPTAGYFDHVRDEVIALVPRGARRLLDVGCGSGATAAAARQRLGIAEVVGIEAHPEAARVARGRLDQVIEHDLDLLRSEDIPGQFDVIVCADVLEHTRDPWHVLSVLAPHLAPGGALVVSVPNLRHVRPLGKILLDRFEYEPEGILDRTHLRFFTLHTLRGLLAGAGFVIERRSAKRSHSWRHRLLEIATLGAIRPFLVVQHLVRARRPGEAPAHRAP